MALTITKEPYDIGYSKNPVDFEIDATGTTWGASATGTPATARLNIPTLSNVVTSTTISFYFLGKTLTFTCVPFGTALTSNAANEFNAYDVSLPDIDFLETVIANLKQNWEFRRNFTAVAHVSTNYITFTKTGEPCSDFVLTTNITSATISNNNVGVLPYLPSDYKVIADVFSAIASSLTPNWIPVAELEVQPTGVSPYRALFHLSDIVDKAIPMPLPTNFTAVHYIEHRKIYIEYAEQTEGIGRRYYYSPIYYLIKGGVNLQTYLLNPNYVESGGLLDTSNGFMSLQPTFKTTTIQQPEFLYFYWYDADDANAKIQVTSTNAAGTNNTFFLHTFNLRRNTIHCIPIGWNQTGNTTDIKRWTAQVIINLGVSVSVIQTYEVPAICPTFQRYFQFLSPLGGIDTLMCTEGAQIGLKTDKELLKKYWNWTAEGNTAVFYKSYIDTIRISTGLYTRPHLLWMRDFFAAKEVWEVKTDGTRIPIIINTDTITIADESADLFRVGFEYQYTAEYQN